jgi:hypothetical protein
MRLIAAPVQKSQFGKGRWFARAEGNLAWMMCHIYLGGLDLFIDVAYDKL